MNVTKDNLRWAATEGVISNEQADDLWLKLTSRVSEAASTRSASQPARFDLAHLAFYFGALIVIVALGWFTTLSWELIGDAGLLALTIVYAVCFVLAGRTLWHRDGMHVPGGLLITVAVSLTPLAVFALERMLGVWPQGDPGAPGGYHMWVKGSWFVMEVATIIAGLVALKFFRFPFLTAPIAFTLWYMSMDLAPLLFGKDELTWTGRLQVSLAFGLVMLVVSYLVDRRTGEDYAFWGYLFGMLAFWFGLSLMESSSELNKFFYFLINLALMLLSVLLVRRVFIVFGTIGVLWYTGHLAHTIFRDSLLFPAVLTLLGLWIIFLGVMYQRRREQLEQWLHDALPQSVRRLLPQERVGSCT